LARPPVEYPKKRGAQVLGLQHINLSTSLCAPKDRLEQQLRVAEQIMPAWPALSSSFAWRLCLEMLLQPLSIASVRD